MKSYFEARERGDARTAALLESRTFTCASGFALGMSLVASLVYVVAFTDSRADAWIHFWQSFEVVVVLSTAFGYFFWREQRGPFPVWVRRLFWRAIVWGYVAVAICLTAMLFQPFARFQLFRTLLNLGVVLPLPVMAWRLLQKTRNG